jgi:hypothetical protein
VKSTTYEAPHYAAFPNCPSLHLSSGQIFFPHPILKHPQPIDVHGPLEYYVFITHLHFGLEGVVDLGRNKEKGKAILVTGSGRP